MPDIELIASRIMGAQGSIKADWLCDAADALRTQAARIQELEARVKELEGNIGVVL